MNTDNDYDNDGNNIVPCPICLDVYCPSKNDGKCPEEDEYAKSFETLSPTPLTVGNKVIITDGVYTGMIGTVGGYSDGGSVAICSPEFDGHDCNGLCISGGRFEPEYALEKVSEESLIKVIQNLRNWNTTLTTQHTKEKEEIVRKLDRYIEHRIECIKQFEEDAECDCGLTETLHYIT